ncbi:MAG: hypothetical protein LBJ13_03810 [Puniceicoccales bacterium]|jgi:hypothetical protein|nr:hypothetical protein [Puniceicoccales bacterium]
MNAKSHATVAIILGILAPSDSIELFAGQKAVTQRVIIRSTPSGKIKSKKKNPVLEKNLSWLAKVNYSCRLGSQVALTDLSSLLENPPKKPTVNLEITDGSLFFPCFFKKLSINMPNGKRMVVQSGIYGDEKIQSLLGNENLDSIASWRSEWQNGGLLLCINYNGENFQILPTSERNLTLLEQTRKRAWSTPIWKKAAIGTLAVGATAATAYGIYNFLAVLQSDRIPNPSEVNSSKMDHVNWTTSAQSPTELITQHTISEPSEVNLSQVDHGDGTALAQQRAKIKSTDYFNINTFRAHRSFEQQYPNIILAGAKNLSYRCHTQSMGISNLLQNSKNPFETMLNLKHDLSVAENQCDWGAKETIAKALLAIIEKYGTLPQSIDSPEMQEMVDAQNMAALHAAIALKQVLIQKKTTEICKANHNLSQNELYKSLIRRSIEQDLGLDQSLEQYLKTAENSAFLMGGSIFPTGPNGQLNDIMELAKIIDNTKFMDAIFTDVITHPDAKQNSKYSYKNAVMKFIDQNFNFAGKEFLRKLALDYFMKIYDKAAHFLRVLASSSRFKLRDYNGRDIYGNINVCTYCSTFELIRSNPGNKNFIAFGGMFDMSEIDKVLNNACRENGYQFNLYSPYKRHDENGRKVYDTTEEREKWNKKINDFIESHIQPPSHTCYLRCTKDGKAFFLTHEEYEEYKKFNESAQPKPLIDLFCTNDLSSRIRVETSYLVWANNMNEWIQRSPFLQSGTKEKFLIPIYKTILPRLSHGKLTVCEALQDYTLPVFGGMCCVQSKQHVMFVAYGISVVVFNEPLNRETYWPKKRFLIETTWNFSESAWVDLELICMHVATPFAPCIGNVGFNNHARLIFQY